jgi:hypothetical protein
MAIGMLIAVWTNRSLSHDGESFFSMPRNAGVGETDHKAFK